MSFLLDTDTCSAHLKENGKVSNRVSQYGGRLYVSTVTVGELYTWALRANAPRRRLPEVDDFFMNVVVPLDVTPEIGRKFGELRARLFDLGKPCPEIDLLIATTAIVHDLTLVTHNYADYVSVPGLHMEDWVAL